MKSKTIRLLCALLACCMVAGSFAACAKNTESDETTAADTTAGTGTDETETQDNAQVAYDALDKVDFGGNDLVILGVDVFKNEIVGVKGTVEDKENADQVINEAVYQRNTLLEERFHMKIGSILKSLETMDAAVRKEVQAPTGDFQIIDHRLAETSQLACSNMLLDYNNMDIDLDQPWWDSGTADFSLGGGIYFMNGSINFKDDDVTYVLIFNKDMQKKFGDDVVPVPYDLVNNNEWTLEKFNSVIQNVSADNGDGKWGKEDTYGFDVTYEYGTTFFFGAGLRYILNDRNTEFPTLYLEDKSRMDKALQVLDLSKSIYHDNNASFMSPPGSEDQGYDMFKEGRALFFGEVAQNLAGLKADMEEAYGVVPVPKYDKNQEHYLTWTHESGSTFSVVSCVPDDQVDAIGTILEGYAILSHIYLKPAYYDVMLTSRNVNDPESAAMLDIIFRNRVYDMAIPFYQLNLKNTFRDSVDNNNDSFSSSYKKASKSCERMLKRILQQLNK